MKKSFAILGFSVLFLSLFVIGFVQSLEECVPQYTKTCYHGDIFWKDSCNVLGDLIETCPGASCIGGSCTSKNNTECIPHYSKSCYQGNVFWKDSCGFLGDLTEECPESSCSEGICLQGEKITEQVNCVFKNSNSVQKCYTAEDNSRAFCSGAETCVTDLSGYLGEKITWKSSCGNYVYTKIDGEAKLVEFNCNPDIPQVIPTISPAILEKEITPKGFKFAYWQCYNGDEMKFGNDFSCNTGDILKKNAEEFCKDKCKTYEKETKCGINSFSVLEECYSNPERLPEKNSSEENLLTKTLICKDSCPLENQCYPFGYRKSEEYCSDVGQFIAQLKSDESCDNNFECSSNICVNAKCISGNLLDKIISWFKSLFGGN
jgi:hypothetical protein